MPKKLVWRGETDDLQTVSDGNYEMVLSVVDIAGNEFAVGETVRIKNTQPEIKVNLDVAENMLLFNFEHNKEDLINSWKLSITDKDGNILKELSGDGTDVPDRVEYPLDNELELRHLRFSVSAEDLAGNQFKLSKAIPSLFSDKIPFAKLRGKLNSWQDF